MKWDQARDLLRLGRAPRLPGTRLRKGINTDQAQWCWEQQKRNHVGTRRDRRGVPFPPIPGESNAGWDIARRPAPTAPSVKDSDARRPDVVSPSSEEVPETAPLPPPSAGPAPSSSRGIHRRCCPFRNIGQSCDELAHTPIRPPGSGICPILSITRARLSLFPDDSGTITEFREGGSTNPDSPDDLPAG